MSKLLDDIIMFYNDMADPLGLPYYIPKELQRDFNTTPLPESLDERTAPNFDPPGTMDQNIWDIERNKNKLKKKEQDLIPENHTPKLKRT